MKAWIVAVGMAAGSAMAVDQDILKLWPAGAPDLAQGIGEEQFQPDKGDGIKRLTNVSDPRLEIFRPEKPNGTAVVVCPGGGYSILAVSHEGSDVCAWLNRLGITAFMLTYRVPGQRDGAYQDAQRAIGLVRSGAKDLALRTDRIGVLGFSAGGHLAARISAHTGSRTYARVDAADDVSCRPDFSVLVYPAYLTTTNAAGGTELALPAGKETPPAFLVHAANDRISPENSIAWFLALRKAGVEAELHVYGDGGHGFGMKPVPQDIRTWPDRCADWLRSRGLATKP